MFRREALAAQRQKLHGDVFLTQPLTFSIIILLVVTIVLMLGGFLVAGSYSRSGHVLGDLVPSKGLVKLQASKF
ncbi:MAG: hypothetical protein AB3N28_09375 [Kordiimonas sp.]